MFESFVEWANQIALAPPSPITKAVVTESKPSNNSSARLDLDTPSKLARITGWENGEYLAEVIDIHSEKTVYSNQGMFSSMVSIPAQLKSFFETVGVGIE